MTTQTPADNRQTPECGDPIVESVVGDLRDRSRVGQRKYGVTLARTDLSAVQWFEHLYHELLDAALYAKRLSCFTPQASTGREWERECEVLPSSEGCRVHLLGLHLYLTTSGRWVNGREWCDLPPSESFFPTADAALAALAQAPDPRTPQAGPASDKGHPDTINPVADPDFVARMPAPPPASEAERAKWRKAVPEQEFEDGDRIVVAVPCTHTDRGELSTSARHFWDVSILSVHCDAETPIRFTEGGEPWGWVWEDAEWWIPLRDITASLPPVDAAPSPPPPADAGSVSVPREVVERVMTRIDALGRMSDDISNPLVPPIVRSLVDASNALAAALSAPSTSPATTARAGFTYPDEAVEDLQRAIEARWQYPHAPLVVAASALRAARVTSPPTLPPTPPATVQVPLELAREWVKRRAGFREGLPSDLAAARLYDTLAAGVKEADCE